MATRNKPRLDPPVTPQNRTQQVQVNIRMTQADKERLEAAIASIAPGVRVPLAPWILSLALAEADRLLGKQKP